MFKTCTIYQAAVDPAVVIDLESSEFVPCGPTQAMSVGWVPPRGENHGALCESIGGQRILKLMIETKKVPSEILDRKLTEACAEIEQVTGRKPGKKQKKELKEELILTLLPSAFPSRSAVLVWFDAEAGVLVIDATGAKAEIAIAAVGDGIPGITLSLLNTKFSPAACMASWLLGDEVPVDISIDRSCELKATDESKAKVKYDNHDLDMEEVRDHITAGKLPTRLALTWNDRVSFVLTDALTLKKVELLDVVTMNDMGDADAFDADVAITTGELRLMFTRLFYELGGIVTTQGETS